MTVMMFPKGMPKTYEFRHDYNGIEYVRETEHDILMYPKDVKLPIVVVAKGMIDSDDVRVELN